MTVAELIEHLTKLPQDARVWCEGCDCNNAAKDVELREGRGNSTVLITIGDDF